MPLFDVGLKTSVSNRGRTQRCHASNAIDLVLLIIFAALFSRNAVVSAAVVHVDVCALARAAATDPPSPLQVYLNATSAGTSDSLMAFADECIIDTNVSFVLPGDSDSAMQSVTAGATTAKVTIVLRSVRIHGDVLLLGAAGVTVSSRVVFILRNSVVNASTSGVQVGNQLSLVRSQVLIEDSSIYSGVRVLYFGGALSFFRDFNVTVLRSNLSVFHNGLDTRVGVLSFVRDSARCPLPLKGSLLSSGIPMPLLSDSSILVAGSNLTVETWDGYRDWPYAVSLFAPAHNVSWIVHGSQVISNTVARVGIMAFCQNHGIRLIATNNSVTVQPTDTFRVLYFSDTTNGSSVLVNVLVVTSRHRGVYPRQDQFVVAVTGTALDTAMFFNDIRINMEGASLEFLCFARRDDTVPLSRNTSFEVANCDCRHDRSSRSWTSILSLGGFEREMSLLVRDNHFPMTLDNSVLFIKAVAGLNLVVIRNVIEYSYSISLLHDGGEQPERLSLSNSSIIVANNTIANFPVTVLDIRVGVFAIVSNVNFSFSGRLSMNAAFSCSFMKFAAVDRLNLFVDADEFDARQSGTAVFSFSRVVNNSLIHLTRRRGSLGYPSTWMQFAGTMVQSPIVLTSSSLISTSSHRSLLFTGSIVDSNVIACDVNITVTDRKPSAISGVLFFPGELVSAGNVTGSRLVLQRLNVSCWTACGVASLRGFIRDSAVLLDHVVYHTAVASTGRDAIGWSNVSVGLAGPASDEVALLPAGDGDADEVRRSPSALPNRLWLVCVSPAIVANCSSASNLQTECDPSRQPSIVAPCSPMDCLLSIFRQWVFARSCHCDALRSATASLQVPETVSFVTSASMSRRVIPSLSRSLSPPPVWSFIKPSSKRLSATMTIRGVVPASPDRVASASPPTTMGPTPSGQREQQLVRRSLRSVTTSLSLASGVVGIVSVRFDGWRLAATSTTAAAASWGSSADLMWVAGLYECPRRMEPTGLVIAGFMPLRYVAKKGDININDDLTRGGDVNLLQDAVIACLTANVIAFLALTAVACTIRWVTTRRVLTKQIAAATTTRQHITVVVCPPRRSGAGEVIDHHVPLLELPSAVAPPSASDVRLQCATREDRSAPTPPDAQTIFLAAAGLPATVLAVLGATADPLLSGSFALLFGYAGQVVSARVDGVCLGLVVIVAIFALLVHIGRSLASSAMVFQSTKDENAALLSGIPAWLRVQGQWGEAARPDAFVAFRAMYGPLFDRLRGGSLPGRWERSHGLAELCLAAIGSSLRGALQPRRQCASLSACNLCIALVYVALAATLPRSIPFFSASRLLHRVLLLLIVAMVAGEDVLGWSSVSTVRVRLVVFAAVWRFVETAATTLVHRRLKWESRRRHGDVLPTSEGTSADGVDLTRPQTGFAGGTTGNPLLKSHTPPRGAAGLEGQ